jgi:hypothetical protein
MSTSSFVIGVPDGTARCILLPERGVAGTTIRFSLGGFGYLQNLHMENFMSSTSAPASTVSTAAVAHELVDLCREGRNMEAIEKLYSPKIVSIEPAGSAEMPAEISGIDAVRGKNKWWFDNFEVHSSQANGPFVGEGQFAVQYDFDATEKATGKRNRMIEMALYTVKDGKIVREQFFYNTTPK